MLAHAEAMIVTAQTVRDGRRCGVSAFLVELGSEGVTRADIPDTGWRPMGRGAVHFDAVRLPADALIGPEGAAFSRVLGGFDFTRPLLALTGIGCAQACVDETVQYARDREAFGSPLARFEGIPSRSPSTRRRSRRPGCSATRPCGTATRGRGTPRRRRWRSGTDR